MRLKFSIVLTLFFISLIGFAQTDLPEIIPPTPNAASLGKYGDIPIGLFTGSPQINIPLYNFKSRSLNVPITLRYSSNGVRVDEYSSHVGMGWDLSSGGVITRRVNDDPDENQQVSMPDPQTQLYSQAMADFLVDYSTVNGGSTAVDHQPDEYSFNFNGYSGKFYLDDNSTTITSRTPIFLEPTPLKIEILTTLSKTTENTTGDFKVTDPNGIVYYFGGTNAIDKNRSYSSCSSGTPNYNVESAWYLRKMTHPNGDEINFVYESKTIVYDNGVSQNVTHIDGANPDGTCTNSDDICLSISSNLTSYLKEINATGFGKVTFTYSHKTGMPGNMDKLDKILTYDKNNVLIKEEIFEYQSYGTGSSNLIHSSLQQAYHGKRFFLTKVTEKSKTGVLKPPHEFEYYNPEQLPSRFSASQDYWGYYNGKSNYNLIDLKTVQSVTTGNSILANSLSSFIAANRDPDFQYGLKGILKKVTYPTGGYNTLYYDPHSYAGTTTVLPAITTQTASIHNVSGTSSDEFTTPSIPFNQDADLDFIVNIDEAFGGGFGGPPLTFLVEVKDAVSNQLTSLYEIVNNNQTSISNPFTVTVPNFGNQYIAKLTAGRTYKVKVTVSRANTTGTAKLNYYATNGTTTTTNVEVGGLRIAKVETNDGNGDLQTKNYHYGTLDDLTESSGRLINRNSDPMIMQNKLHYEVAGGPVSQFNLSKTCTTTTLFSNSAFPVYGAYHIGYESVIEEYGNNFEGGGVKSVFDTTFLAELNVGLLGNYIPGTSLSNFFQFGKQLEKSTFKKVGNDYKILSKSESFYNHDTQLDLNTKVYNTREKATVNGIFSITINEQVNRFEITEYSKLRQWHYLDKTINTQFDENGLNPVATTTEYYYDNPDHLQVTRTKTTVSDDDPIITKTYYPDDVSGVSSLGFDNLSSNVELLAINKLKALNRVAEPIQSETYKDLDNDGLAESNELLNAQRTNYREWTYDMIFPEYIQTLKGVYNSSTNKLQDRLQFHSYYTNGNVKEVSKKDGSKIVYIWGYNEQYPIAKIENATYTEVSSQVGNLQTKSNADNDHTIGTAGNEGALRAALTTLRNTSALSDALVTTFTYDPQIGVTSVTDPTGQIIYYHYDSFNRLEMVTDKDNKVLSKNEYHYKN